ncbi:hypothetical protein [Neolewinella persica]|uniref:hypothetical protein n=1 Tax=Neolewinella persica TaxID=70998 RepID=UPI00039D6880|nr:hypothetical protein [Neolewinella persica]
MLASTKQIIIYGAFGLLLGAKIVEVLLAGGAGLLDWWLLIIGLTAAIVHYLPEHKDAANKSLREQRHSEQEPQHDALVLRDPADAERSDLTAHYPEEVERRMARR